MRKIETVRCRLESVFNDNVFKKIHLHEFCGSNTLKVFLASFSVLTLCFVRECVKFTGGSELN